MRSLMLHLGVALVAVVAARSVTAAPIVDPDVAAARLVKVQGYVARQEAAFGRVDHEVRDLIRAKVSLDRQLLLPGESVTLEIEAQSEATPNPRLTVLQDCFADPSAVHEFQLEWEPSGPGRHRAEWTWTPPAKGNYLVKWDCDIGGDIPQFQRNFSVIDGKWAVVVINSNANGAHPPEKHFHELGIPSNLFSGIQLFAELSSADAFASLSRDARRYGDGYTVCLWQSNTYVAEERQDVDAICMYDEPPAVRDAVLEGYRTLMALCGFDRDRTQIMVGPISNSVMRAARQSGYDTVVGLYADQNWDDSGGHVQINHWGMPSRPFFMSSQDFRKQGDGGPAGVLGVQQCQRHTVLCRDYNCVFALEPGADYMMDRYDQIHRPRTVSPVTWSREADFFEALFRCAPLSDAPLFFTGCFEFAGFDWMPELYLIQEEMARWLHGKMGQGDVAPATPWGVAEFYRRHYPETPESVVYLPDTWAGRVDTGYDRPKPPAHPDTLEVENGLFKAIFRRGDLLPYACYDYTTEWDYPHRDLSGAPRNTGGYVIPNTDDRFRIDPPILDTRAFDATLRLAHTDEVTRVEVTVEARAAHHNLPLALWDLPREFISDPAAIALEGARRFIPVRAPYTDNFCGILVADVREGRNTVTLEIRSPSRRPESIDLTLGDALLVKVFERDGQATAYAYNIGQTEASFTLAVPEDCRVFLHPHASDSDAPVSLKGNAAVTLVPRKPVKITGLSLAHWREACPQAEPVFLTVDSPYVVLPGRER